MAQKTKVLMTVTCKEMKNPKLQRSRFDETLVTNSWILQGNDQPVIHTNGSVTTTTTWGRVFGNRISEEKIRKQVQNMLSRASQYADIDNIKMSLTLEKINKPEDDFQATAVLLQDD